MTQLYRTMAAATSGKTVAAGRYDSMVGELKMVRRSRLSGPKFSAVLAALLILSPTAILACPEETVTLPAFTVRQLRGTIHPPDGDGLLPTEIELLVREKGNRSTERKVAVQPDGTFILGVPEGTYEYQIRAEGFLFTVVGDVNVTLEANQEETINIHPPWC